jgi:hypothetical protein
MTFTFWVHELDNARAAVSNRRIHFEFLAPIFLPAPVVGKPPLPLIAA